LQAILRKMPIGLSENANTIQNRGIFFIFLYVLNSTLFRLPPSGLRFHVKKDAD
jgi:hypothetical protein